MYTFSQLCDQLVTSIQDFAAPWNEWRRVIGKRVYKHQSILNFENLCNHIEIIKKNLLEKIIDETTNTLSFSDHKLTQDDLDALGLNIEFHGELSELNLTTDFFKSILRTHLLTCSAFISAKVKGLEKEIYSDYLAAQQPGYERPRDFNSLQLFLELNINHKSIPLSLSIYSDYTISHADFSAATLLIDPYKRLYNLATRASTEASFSALAQRTLQLASSQATQLAFDEYEIAIKATDALLSMKSLSPEKEEKPTEPLPAIVLRCFVTEQAQLDMLTKQRHQPLFFSPNPAFDYPALIPIDYSDIPDLQSTPF